MRLLLLLLYLSQFMIGHTLPFLPGRVEALETQGITYTDVTRILPPGQSIVMVAFITLTYILVLDHTRYLNIISLIQWSLLGLAVLISFTRSFWVQAFIAILLIFLLEKIVIGEEYLGWV